MSIYIVRFAAVGVAIPLGAFLLSFAMPLFTNVQLKFLLVLCPSYILFMGTASCEPFSSCTLHVLAIVVATNAILYGVVGGAVWYIGSKRQRRTALAQQGT